MAKLSAAMPTPTVGTLTFNFFFNTSVSFFFLTVVLLQRVVIIFIPVWKIVLCVFGGIWVIFYVSSGIFVGASLPGVFVGFLIDGTFGQASVF